MEKPQPHEYPQSLYTSRYIDQVTGHPLEMLRQKNSWRLLYSIGDEKALFRYAPGKWSIKELLGHITDTERILAYRILCISRGETQPLPGFDEDAYVKMANFDQRPIASLLAEYLAVRGATLQLCENLPVDAWMRIGTANGNPLSVRALAFILAGHEQHHIQVLKEKYQLASFS